MRLVADTFSIGWDGTLVRVAIAAALGGAIGLERELDEKAAGLRTHMLVSVGSALFTLVSAYGFSGILGHSGSQVLVRLDPSRIAAQIVTGIGFLGAGVIFRQGFTIRGLTTAASLWLVAAIGMAAGAGYWAGAVLATAAGLLSLRPLERLKERMLPQRAANRLLVELAEGATSGEVLDVVERHGDLLALRRDGKRLELELHIDRAERTPALDAVSALPSVEEARWQG
jgi:putative Mg2+ transporter-C (MgtC) family protein